MTVMVNGADTSANTDSHGANHGNSNNVVVPTILRK